MRRQACVRACVVPGDILHAILRILDAVTFVNIVDLYYMMLPHVLIV